MDFEALRIGGVGFIQPTSQSLPARVAVVLPLSACSLSIEPTLSNANYLVFYPVENPVKRLYRVFCPSKNPELQFQDHTR